MNLQAILTKGAYLTGCYIDVFQDHRRIKTIFLKDNIEGYNKCLELNRLFKQLNLRGVK